MNYRLFTSLLLMAVLSCLYLWWSQPEDSAENRTAQPPAPSHEQGDGRAPLGQLKIF